MSINSIQRRHPWLMTPLHLFGRLTSPEAWACAFDRVATRLTRAIVVDTTSLGRRVQRANVLVPVRDALLRHSGFLRWLDWQVRKLFWSLVWCGIGLIQGWPRRVAIPERERPSSTTRGDAESRIRSSIRSFRRRDVTTGSSPDTCGATSNATTRAMRRSAPTFT